jgi:predicted outer membrane repeat protein
MAHAGGGANINETDDNHVSLVGNRVCSNTATNGGGILVGNCSVTMRSNLVYTNAAVQGGGVWINSSEATLVNNIVANNRATTGNRAAGLLVRGSSVRALHTTIARNSGGHVDGVLITDFFGETSAVTMTNTILVGHKVGILVEAGHLAAAEATLWGADDWANGVDWTGSGTMTTGTVNIWGNPAFVAPEIGDYHVLPSSAAAGAGVDAGVTDDIDSDPRPAPRGTSPDLGADEVSQRQVCLPLVIRSYQARRREALRR